MPHTHCYYRLSGFTIQFACSFTFITNFEYFLMMRRGF